MSATTTAIAKPRARRVTAVAHRGPDLEALDSFLTEAAGSMAPMLSRPGVLRRRMAVELKAAESELASVEDRERLLDELYQAAKRTFASEREAIGETISMYRSGLLDVADHQPEGNET
jgi:hypothetical protein